MKTLQSMLRKKKKQHPLNKMFFDRLQNQVKQSPGFQEVLSYDMFKSLVEAQMNTSDISDVKQS